jgi:Ca-activated chloride channel family protein
MNMRFEVETDRPLIASDSVTRYVLATIVAPEGAARERPPVNLGLVLDRSGSMGGDKIRLARDAAVAAIRRLDSRDRFCVVAYDDVVEVVVPSTAASARAVADAVRAIMSIEARGSTDLCAGWLRGCEQVAIEQAPDAVTRVILLTDGLANHGVTDAYEIVGHAAELRRRGVSTTTIGVGADFDEHLLGRMADEGGGHFYYVQRDVQIPSYIETEVGESLEVTLRGAELRVGPASVASIAPIAHYPTRRDGDEWVIALGDLVSLQELELPLRVSFPRNGGVGPVGSAVRMSFSLAGAGVARVSSDIVWTIVTGPEVGAQRRNRRVDRAVAEAYAALARREAGRLNRDGDFAGARRQLGAVARNIQGYALDDAQLQGLARDLERDAVEHEEQLSAMELKMSYMRSEQSLKGRDASGASRRRPNRP